MSDHNVFISYARADKHWAVWLGERLGAQGYRIWTDSNSVPVGESWIVELRRTIERADVVVAVLSPSYFQSTWCQGETALALASKVPVIPVKVEPCEVRGILANYIWADLTADRERGLRAVLEAVERLPAESAA